MLIELIAYEYRRLCMENGIKKGRLCISHKKIIGS